MTDQELFDRVATHLLTQNRKSQSLNGACQYRHYTGLKCAIGVLIPDELYRTAFEGQGIDTYARPSSWSADILHAAGILESQVHLAKRLQDCHDDYEPHEWVYQLKTIAIDHDLDFNLSPSTLDTQP